MHLTACFLLIFAAVLQFHTISSAATKGDVAKLQQNIDKLKNAMKSITQAVDSNKTSYDVFVQASNAYTTSLSLAEKIAIVTTDVLAPIANSGGGSLTPAGTDAYILETLQTSLEPYINCIRYGWNSFELIKSSATQISDILDQMTTLYPNVTKEALKNKDPTP